MEQHHIKSALEIALEKAERLGKFTEEEARRQQEKDYRPVGEALARKLVAGMTARDLAIELKELPPEGSAIVRRAAFELLVSLLDVASLDKAEAAALAVEMLTGTQRVREGVRALIADYRQAQEARLQGALPNLERAARQELERLGFSGPAVQAIPERSQQWRQAQAKLDAEYQERLAQAREQLLKLPLPEGSGGRGSP